MSIMDGRPGVSMLLPKGAQADVNVWIEKLADLLGKTKADLQMAQVRCADLERQLSEERQRTAAAQAAADLSSQRAASAERAAAVERQRADDAITRAQSATNPDAALRVQLDAEIAKRARAEGELVAIKAQMAAEDPTYKVLVTKRDGNDRIVEITMKPEA